MNRYIGTLATVAILTAVTGIACTPNATPEQSRLAAADPTNSKVVLPATAGMWRDKTYTDGTERWGDSRLDIRSENSAMLAKGTLKSAGGVAVTVDGPILPISVHDAVGLFGWDPGYSGFDALDQKKVLLFIPATGTYANTPCRGVVCNPSFGDKSSMTIAVIGPNTQIGSILAYRE
jgi:hypothetical protein